jgi:hypothetical protein
MFPAEFDDIGYSSELLAAEVDPAILSVLSREHSVERPAIPFAWMVSYTGRKALLNIGYFENGVRHCKLDFPIRVFFSNWTDAIVISFVPLEAIREPHVLEWYSSFREVPVEEAKALLTAHPKFPYDGRSADLVRAEILASGGPQSLLDKSRATLKERGIDIPPKF